ncbi:MAG: hypothetical protein VZS44_01780 [Bacilli bacterium]|nr:hypothetical protein [Bacilli bacterium]
MNFKEKNNEIDINHLIALTNIIDKYKDFNNNVLIFIRSVKNNRELITKLDKISKKETCLIDMGAKKFYTRNRTVIDTINKYTSIHDFICSNYDYHGNSTDNYDKLNYYYEYLLKNKENIEQIKKILTKIKKLGFEKIDFDESYDFTKSDYYFTPKKIKIGKAIVFNNYLNYLENIEILPGFDADAIEYYTKGSNYRMMISGFGEESPKNKIMLNNLVFDINSLPDKISEDLYFQIINQKKSNLANDKKVRTAVELSTAIDDLETQCLKTNNSINKLEDISNKQELKETLLEIIENIRKLREIENNYYNEITTTNDNITNKRLIKEKRAYREKRYWHGINLD